jgi:hypothetical protein
MVKSFITPSSECSKPSISHEQRRLLISRRGYPDYLMHEMPNGLSAHYSAIVSQAACSHDVWRPWYPAEAYQRIRKDIPVKARLEEG